MRKLVVAILLMLACSVLAPRYRDSQRRYRRQRRHRSRSRLGAADRHSTTPRISLCALHQLRRGQSGPGIRIRNGGESTDDDQPYGSGRGA